MAEFERKSFDPNAYAAAELEKVEKEKQVISSIDEKKLLLITNKLERLKSEEAEFKAMEANGTKSIKTKYFSITYVDEHTTTRFDEKGFAASRPRIAKEMAKFRKTSTVSASVKITLRKQKDGAV
jgi:uncharacterized protein YkuJ